MHNNPLLMRQRNNTFPFPLQTGHFKQKKTHYICKNNEGSSHYSFSLRYITNIFIISLRIICNCLLIFVYSFIKLLGAQTTAFAGLFVTVLEIILYDICLRERTHFCKSWLSSPILQVAKYSMQCNAMLQNKLLRMHWNSISSLKKIEKQAIHCHNICLAALKSSYQIIFCWIN